jgi:hypothetical protein
MAGRIYRLVMTRLGHGLFLVSWPTLILDDKPLLCDFYLLLDSYILGILVTGPNQRPYDLASKKNKKRTWRLGDSYILKSGVLEPSRNLSGLSLPGYVFLAELEPDHVGRHV